MLCLFWRSFYCSPPTLLASRPKFHTSEMSLEILESNVSRIKNSFTFVLAQPNGQLRSLYFSVEHMSLNAMAFNNPTPAKRQKKCFSVRFMRHACRRSMALQPKSRKIREKKIFTSATGTHRNYNVLCATSVSDLYRFGRIILLRVSFSIPIFRSFSDFVVLSVRLSVRT